MVTLYHKWHHQKGSRDELGIRGVLGCIRKDRGVIVAPLHGILTKKMVVFPTIVSGRVLVSSKGWDGEKQFES